MNKMRRRMKRRTRSASSLGPKSPRSPPINRWRLIQQVFHWFEWRIHAGGEGEAVALHRSAREVTPGCRHRAAPTSTVPQAAHT